MSAQRLRVFSTMLVLPLVLSAVWTIPYLHHSAFGKWAVLNTLFAYAAFFASAIVSHVLLRLLRMRAGWQFGVVKFCVAFAGFLSFALYSTRGYGELYHSNTQIVAQGALTEAGFRLYVVDSATQAALLSVLFFIFWLITVRAPSSKESHA